jgi:hypothetical protein
MPDPTTINPAYLDSLGLARGVTAEVRDGRVVISATDPRAFRSEAFVGALAAVKREQAAFREMLRTYRAPAGDADG